jgi:starch phosphorylase
MPEDELDSAVIRLAARVASTHERLQRFLRSNTAWGTTHSGVLNVRPVAYFSAEFGLHESLPTYSGGLGILAGDHLKSASDLDVPLIGIGLFYDHGYFVQRINRSGCQEEHFVPVDPRKLPLDEAIGTDGEPVIVRVSTRGRSIAARVWSVTVGRRRLLLLDSDVDSNSREDRELTSRLYWGGVRVRIRQELLLGVGGLRALEALGVIPGVMHLNEGHSAFAILEAVRQRMTSEGIDVQEAIRRVSRQIVFTTHTPVPAGHDWFAADLIEEHLGPLREQLGISHTELMKLGAVPLKDRDGQFCMTALALRHAKRSNAVSCLHGEVSRSMWRPLWPDRPEEDVPIGHITNGIHVPTWLSPAMRRLYDRHLGPDWRQLSDRPETWNAIPRVDDQELWETHQAVKARLLDFVRCRLIHQHGQGDKTDPADSAAIPDFKTDVLTIGFARRFVTYKRPGLLRRDFDKLVQMVNGVEFPVRFIFAGKAHPDDERGKSALQEAGKAHPDDERGKSALQEMVRLSLYSELAGKFLFLENYEMDVARYLIQGVDVWLNTPRRPLEASGTSGQKVAINGGLNLSILDGWWAEAYDGTNGFAIGAGTMHNCKETQDTLDGEAVYETLQEQVIPMYYRRDEHEIPRDWIARMKRAIQTLAWRFNADRMLLEYTKNCYLPAAAGVSFDMNRV